MKNLIDKLFKKESELNYILPQYQPAQFDLISTRVVNKEYDLKDPAESFEIDDMQIDNIYQRM
ncbi:MAG TPA: hypothetical protein PKL42_05205 [Methylotenera sp.]|jgi:hypothetical protein|nr:hypothetical protein [Methylotenera sp.]HPV32638.1 hypothetical protein [Methylotenera sp.]